MSVEIEKILPYIIGFAMFFIGRWKREIDSDIKELKKNSSESKLNDAIHDERLKTLRIKNEEAGIKMKEEMYKMSNSLSSLLNVTSSHEVKIANLESGQKIITNEIKGIKNLKRKS